MTDLERERAGKLSLCRFPIGRSYPKGLVRELAAVTNDPDAKITDRQAWCLERIAWTYRKQLTRLGWGQVAPQEKPAAPMPGRAKQQPEERLTRERPKERERREKLERAQRGEW